MQTTRELLDPRAEAILGAESPFEQLATGFVFTEGALWHPAESALYFSDIIGNRMLRWSAVEGIGTFREPSHMANGNAWDLQGRLLTCEHATSRVTRTEADGQVTVLASHHDGRELNSPNDIVVARDGAIYFTDPIFGRRLPYGIARAPQQPCCGVYRIDPASGDTQLLADDFEQPNGLCFSPDQRLLYVNDSPRRSIQVFDVAADGRLGNARPFATTPGDEPGVPDGMKVDMQGNVYCCGPGGLHLFAPDGTRLARIRTPEKACNFAFGDADFRSVYITASTSLYRIRVQIPGIAQMPGAQGKEPS